ncbi:MAG: choice-of-anchor D domain-containing protein [Myxococcota bacterium]
MLIALLACAPAKPSLGDPAPGAETTPDIEISDPVVEFEAVGDQVAVATVTVTDVGDGELTLEPPVIDDVTGVFTVGELGATALAPGESTTFDVIFDPAAGDAATATVVIASNDPDDPTTTVTVLGRRASPAIALDPAAWDYGRLSRDCVADVLFTVTNDGDSPLTITEIAVDGGDGAFTVTVDEATWGPLPWTLQPGDGHFVTATFQAPYLGAFSGSLVVTSDDPQNPRAAALLDGEGIAETEVVDDFNVAGGVVDVVMAVYAGDSMEDETDALLDAGAAFAGAMDDALLDWRLAVLNDDDGCVPGDDNWIDGTMSSGTQLDVLETMLSTENPVAHGFTVLEAALDDDALDAGGCNEGLLRDNARLALVGITDQGGAPSAGYAHYVTLFQGLKAEADDVRVHGIAPDRAAGCGWSTTSGWPEAAAATGGTSLLVCDDMEDNLLALAEAFAEPVATFGLSATPDAETLAVYVDGEEATGWTYDAASNSVTLAEDDVVLGVLVTVAYEERSACE